MIKVATLAVLALGVIPLGGQQTDPNADNGRNSESQQTEPATGGRTLIPRPDVPADAVILPRGTRVPLALINSASTKNSAPGDKLYLQSVFPMAVNGRILVPPGTYVTGIVTEVKRPGRIKSQEGVLLKVET